MHARWIGLALVALPLAACGGNSNVDGGRDIGRLEGGNNFIDLSPAFAFEGQRRFVGTVGPSRGTDDLSMGTVSTPMGSPVVIERYECSRIRCAFVAHIDDSVANRGSAIPEPTSAVNVSIQVVGAQLNYTAQLQVFPLDTADAAALGAGQIAPNSLYSSLMLPSGSMLRAGSLGRQIRMAVMNTAEIRGTLDLSATGTMPGPGGHEGGPTPSMDGSGPSAGRGADGAGGGGGHGEAGTNGTAASGTGGMGGAAVMDTVFMQNRGGSGGGASMSGAGGGGGGAFALAFFGDATMDGAQVLLRGGNGEGAGGGGAGGLLLLGGTINGSFSVDLAGGVGGMSGGSRGGNGGAGRLRLDGAASGITVVSGMRADGVRFDLSQITPIVRDPALTLRGFAPPGTRVRVQNEISRTVSGQYEATADAAGQWSVSVMMTEGTASFIAYAVSGTTLVPSLSGTTVVVRGAAGARELYSGAVDIAYVPMTE